MRFLLANIRNKLLLITGGGTAVVLAAVAFGLWQMMASMAGYDELGVVEQQESDIQNIASDYNRQIEIWRTVLLRGFEDEERRERYWAAFVDQHERVHAQAQDLHGRVSDTTLTARLEEFISEHEAMKAEYSDAYAIFQETAGDIVSADAWATGSGEAAQAALTDLRQTMAQQLEGETESVSAQAGNAVTMTVLLIALAVAVAFVIFLLLVNRMIVNPATAMRNALQRISEGDFTSDIPDYGDDEIGRIGHSARTIQDSLGTMIRGTAQAVDTLDHSAQQLASTSEEAAQRAEHQKSETESLASAMNEMASTVDEVARNSADASHAAEDADTRSGDGREAVESVANAVHALESEMEGAVNAVRSLNQESESIGTVLSVIESIAEQTNLLALNAAIEAARAGDQGRGFAVVADEVRSLAQRTQGATREIQDMVERVQSGTTETAGMIDETRNRTSTVVERTQQAASNIEGIAGAVARIRDMNHQIASAAEQQSSTATEINQNVESIRYVAEQSTESVRSNRESSEDIARLAGELREQVKRFRT
ncbi:methyl-accepting chemotaxis protein [Aquisalimonas sp.]|uniref:methyl-accepting chemotaxis protein n=1 Tax=Aquisalimonas sp. TaxID=1872621 RepID=UPI0025C4D3E6|nr:methyl-accepting chemotaxis protein [Aquisalimonas sp.]